MSDTTKQQKIKEALENKLSRYFGVAADDASKEQVYKAVILTVKDMLTSGRSAYRKAMKSEKAKRVYYLCMEFLIGPLLRNNLRNLGIADEYAQVLGEMGYDINEIYSMERDPGLGNGGLGRLIRLLASNLNATVGILTKLGECILGSSLIVVREYHIIIFLLCHPTATVAAIMAQVERLIPLRSGSFGALLIDIADHIRASKIGVTVDNLTRALRRQRAYAQHEGQQQQFNLQKLHIR